MKKQRISKEEKAKELEMVEELLKKEAARMDEKIPPFEEVWKRVKEKVKKENQDKS